MMMIMLVMMLQDRGRQLHTVQGHGDVHWPASAVADV